MALTSQNGKIKEDGREKDALTFVFTNGAKAQLEDLRTFLNKPTELDVIELGISLLQNYKEQKMQKERKDDLTK